MDRRRIGPKPALEVAVDIPERLPSGKVRNTIPSHRLTRALCISRTWVNRHE